MIIVRIFYGTLTQYFFYCEVNKIYFNKELRKHLRWRYFNFLKTNSKKFIVLFYFILTWCIYIKISDELTGKFLFVSLKSFPFKISFFHVLKQFLMAISNCILWLRSHYILKLARVIQGMTIFSKLSELSELSKNF